MKFSIAFYENKPTTKERIFSDVTDQVLIAPAVGGKIGIMKQMYRVIDVVTSFNKVQIEGQWETLSEINVTVERI